MVTIKGKDDPMSYDDVKELCQTYISDPDSLALIDRAYDYIMIKHEGQKRKSGEPYTIHLIWVAYILASLQTGPKTIAAGLLHDVMEDCGVGEDEMISLFGEEITTLVEGVTKIGKMPFMDESEVYAENHRKIYVAMANDIRVILIKLSDRLHNMRTLQYMRPDKQQRISRETLEVYAPIAHRLGIEDIRIELEDLCLYYLDPAAYKQISDQLEATEAQRNSSINKMVASVSKILDDKDIKYRIKGRAKHLYSIYKKMYQKHKRFDELYDLNALRIIIDDDKVRCYEVLGIIHDEFRPLPNRFKDYIAMPKPNMYQSLHTTVIGEDGQIFEIQIRTEEMDELAERGVASHWRYKENTKYSAKAEQKDIVNKLQWLGDFVTISDEVKDGDAKDYYDTLRRDIFEANVYVLSPQGKIVELPNGACPIDFAYRIHTEVGHHCVGAVVNGVMVPINTKLKTGDVCEIKTNKNNDGPKEDWLKFVRTASARNKIRQFISKRDAANKEEYIEEGRKLLKEEIKVRGLDEKKYLSPETYSAYYGSFGAKNFDDLLFAIGKKQATAATLLEKVAPNKNGLLDNLSKILKKNNNTLDTQRKTNGLGITVSGMNDLKVQISKCCNPIPGDKIVGYVSKGQGIKVHREDCPNLKNAEKGRLIDVYWDYTNIKEKLFEVDLEIICLDRPNLLNDILTVIGQVKVNILNINASLQDLDAIISLKISLESAETLQLLMDNLNKIQGVYEIKRVIH